MEYKFVISAVAYVVIFLSALFLFIRNYPSDRWFSVVFIVAGGVSFYNSICERVNVARDINDMPVPIKKL
jgi:hypothetical protein